MAEDEVKYAFKCKECGHLEDDKNTGERELPAACRNCGAGVSYDPRSGIKSYDEDNWIVLSELKADDLKEVLDFHKIDKKDIQKIERKQAEEAEAKE